MLLATLNPWSWYFQMRIGLSIFQSGGSQINGGAYKLKVFIGGAKVITTLPEPVIARLRTICEKQYDILVGDCYGVDTAVQEFCANLGYNRVTIYASNGRARNNLGGWPVKCVPVAQGITGFDFYRQKDIAMAEAADCGFMVWDGKSKGTRQNSRTLLEMGKMVLVYNQKDGSMRWYRLPREELTQFSLY